MKSKFTEEESKRINRQGIIIMVFSIVVYCFGAIYFIWN
jgi:hypothetical protein